MIRVLFFILILAGCAATEFQVEHKSNLMPAFDEYWSGCGGLRAATTDKRWALVVNIPTEKSEFELERDITLIDLKNFKNKECALSLFRNNDLGCESAELISTNLSDGIISLDLSHSWVQGTTYGSLDASSLTFMHPEGLIVLDRVRIPKTKLYPFCGG